MFIVEIELYNSVSAVIKNLLNYFVFSMPVVFLLIYHQFLILIFFYFFTTNNLLPIFTHIFRHSQKTTITIRVKFKVTIYSILIRYKQTIPISSLRT